MFEAWRRLAAIAVGRVVRPALGGRGEGVARICVKWLLRRELHCRYRNCQTAHCHKQHTHTVRNRTSSWRTHTLSTCKCAPMLRRCATAAAAAAAPPENANAIKLRVRIYRRILGSGVSDASEECIRNLPTFWPRWIRWRNSRWVWWGGGAPTHPLTPVDASVRSG